MEEDHGGRGLRLDLRRASLRRSSTRKSVTMSPTVTVVTPPPDPPTPEDSDLSLNGDQEDRFNNNPHPQSQSSDRVCGLCSSAVSKVGAFREQNEVSDRADLDYPSMAAAAAAGEPLPCEPEESRDSSPPRLSPPPQHRPPAESLESGQQSHPPTLTFLTVSPSAGGLQIGSLTTRLTSTLLQEMQQQQQSQQMPLAFCEAFSSLQQSSVFSDALSSSAAAEALVFSSSSPTAAASGVLSDGVAPTAGQLMSSTSGGPSLTVTPVALPVAPVQSSFPTPPAQPDTALSSASTQTPLMSSTLQSPVNTFQPPESGLPLASPSASDQLTRKPSITARDSQTIPFVTAAAASQPVLQTSGSVAEVPKRTLPVGSRFTVIPLSCSSDSETSSPPSEGSRKSGHDKESSFTSLKRKKPHKKEDGDKKASEKKKRKDSKENHKEGSTTRHTGIKSGNGYRTHGTGAGTRHCHGNDVGSKGDPGIADNRKTELTKKQIAEKYRVHIFTVAVFACACLFVGLGWYYKNLTRLVMMQSQKIFLDQGNRVLALAGDSHDVKYQMLVGRNLPPLQLPLHCPELDAGPSRECLWREEAVLRVRYEPPTPREGQAWNGVHCYRVSWQALRHTTLPEDCFELQQESTQWYGPSNQSAGVFPVKGTFDFVSSPYHLGNAGTFSSAVELYWLSSKGVGILVNASDPVTVHWNSKVDNHVCVVSNYTGPLFGRSQRAGHLPTLNYTVCVGPNPVTTHLAMRTYARQPEDVTSGRRPSDVMFTYPQWSLSGLTSKADYNQSDVQRALEQLKNENLACDLLHLDGEWQRYQGDLTFDSLRFPELSSLADTVRNASCGLGIQLSPFFDFRADSSFYDGVVNSYFVKDAGGEVPGLVQVRQGAAAAAAALAVLDVSSANARAWFKNKVKALSGSLGGFPLLRSIGLSLGENGWLPYKPTLHDDTVTYWQLRRLMSEMVADLAVSFTLNASTSSSFSSNTRTTFASSASSITGISSGGSGGSNSAGISTSSSGSKPEAGGLLLSHTAGSQTSPAFIPIVTEVLQTELGADGGGEAGTTVCLSGLVERALTLGLMGYAYVMADGVQLPAAPQPQPSLQKPALFPSAQTPGQAQAQSQSQSQAQDHSQELLLRWMQVATFFPAARFHVGPWRHGSESVSMAANLSRLHKEVVLPVLASEEMRNDVENKGLPILRPTWWLEPAAAGQQESLQQVLGTQFLLGNDLLVAPVLCVGQTRRSIYVPEGVWSDPLRGKMIEGPTLLKNYRVGLHEIPYFARAPLWEEEPADNH